MKIVAWAVLTAVLVSCSDDVAETTSPEANSATAVETQSGKVAGKVDLETGTLIFLGIPYAEPPVGDLRFKPPVPVKRWDDVFDATKFGSASAQIYDEESGSLEEFGAEPAAEPPLWVGSEDSLTLNIWTPGVDDAKRPVMVYIHGGANWLESSRQAGYHGQKLSERGDIVVVSMNYRLGIFGFLEVSVLGGDAYRGSTNNGVRDQILALEWVQNNIERFGGDPGQVTVFGESAGSIDITWILTTETPSRYFRRAILMSGVGGTTDSPATMEEGERVARLFFEKAQIESMEQLLEMSTGEVLGAHSKAFSEMHSLEQDSLFYPRIDGDFTTGAPLEAISAGNAKDIDVLIGTTANEMRLWLLWEEDLLDTTPQEALPTWIGDILPEKVEAVTAIYQSNRPGDRPGEIAMDMLSDVFFRVPSTLLAEAQQPHNENVWMYLFKWKIPDSPMGAAHAAELPFVFDAFHANEGFIGTPRDTAEAERWRKLSGAMQDAWIAFARNGDPNQAANPDLPQWPKYHIPDRATMTFDNVNKLANDPKGDEREWWVENLFLQ